jgi:hypothetical protein
MTEKINTLGRRELLHKFTATIGGTVAVTLSSPMVQATPETPSKAIQSEKSVAKGYQRTQHIDTYYQLADF